MIFNYELQGKNVQIRYDPTIKDYVDFIEYQINSNGEFKHKKTCYNTIKKIATLGLLNTNGIYNSLEFETYLRDKCSLLACEKCEQEQIMDYDLERGDLTGER